MLVYRKVILIFVGGFSFVYQPVWRDATWCHGKGIYMFSVNATLCFTVGRDIVALVVADKDVFLAILLVSFLGWWKA